MASPAPIAAPRPDAPASTERAAPGAHAGRDVAGAAPSSTTAVPVAARPPDGYVIDWGTRLRSAVSGRWVAGLVLALYAGFLLNMLASSAYWSPFSTVDEQVTYYQVARNFTRFGFTPTFFLQDVSTASDPALHPFVYNHMPPGPEILVALLMKLAGERYTVIRLVLGLLFLAGLLAFLRFTTIVLAGHGLTGAGFALLFLTPFSMLHAIDHPAYSLFPLLAFLPLVLLDRHYRTAERWALPLALVLVLVASLYLVYQNLVMLVAAWVLLRALRIVRFERRHLVAFLLAAGLGLALHAAQSALLLGPLVFLEETLRALSNRAFGIPTAEDLRAFYRSLDVVHHGDHRLDLLALGAAFLSSARLAEPTPVRSWSIGETTITLALLCTILLWGLARTGCWDWTRGTVTIPRGAESRALMEAARRLGRLALWAIAAIAIALATFPAYSADYGLAGMSEFFLAILTIAVYAFAVSRWRAWLPLPSGAGWGGATWSTIRAVAGSAVLFVLVGWGAWTAVTVWHSSMWTASWQIPDSNPDALALAELGAALRGKVVMTNVYPTTVGFFTEEIALGGCEGQAVGADGRVDPSRCHLVPVRGFGRGATVTPTHYVLFHRKHLTGFTRCRDACMDTFRRAVGARYPTVLASSLYTVFDLTRPRPATMSPGKLS